MFREIFLGVVFKSHPVPLCIFVKINFDAYVSRFDNSGVEDKSFKRKK